MLKQLYSCDICREQDMRPAELYGIRFSNMKDFIVSFCRSTDGVHICTRCMKQLRELPLPERL